MAGAPSHYWVVEHPTRGCFKKFDHDPVTGNWRPFFSWSVLRSDSSVERFWSKTQAAAGLSRIQRAGVLGCYLFEMGSGR